ncbi:unnamed protein product [Meloidogyne enterolobii]|uniref:Uncharacterized protein n=1 Tax=Meloidogyne enterolobii TaxID=390850 RepID=A0ACB0Z026_MELEN
MRRNYYLHYLKNFYRISPIQIISLFTELILIIKKKNYIYTSFSFSLEFLTFIGIFGFIISLFQSYFLDYTKLIKFNWNLFSIFILIFFTFSMVLFYSLVSSVMQRSSALLFNICVLTSDFYSMLAGIFLFGQEFYILYLIAFIIIIFGTILYNREETNYVNENEQL